MKQIFGYFFKLTLFIALVYGVPLAIAFLFGELPAVKVCAVVISSLLFVDLFFTDRLISSYMRPRKVLFSGKTLFEIDDPSAHIFVTRAPFRKTKIWVTRGLLSLLSHRELTEILQELEQSSRSLRLSFETYLTLWGIRFTRGVHSKVEEALFVAKTGRRNFTLTQFILSLPSIGILSLLGRFYRSSEPRRRFETDGMRLVMTSLHREATFSPPALCPVFANHSLIAPWPNALLTLGRPCLHSETGVDLSHGFETSSI